MRFRNARLACAGAFACVALLLVTSPPLRAQVVRDTTLQMSDAVQLDAFYVYPLLPPPAEGYPAVLLVHGFAGSKDQLRATAIGLALQGYAVTGYSVRGQGASGGEFDFFTSGRILGDLRELIAFTKNLPNVRSERVAVMGGSQGGLHAWNAAAYDMGVRAVASFIANGRCEENWLGANAMNWAFAAAWLSTAVRFDTSVQDSINHARESGDFSFLEPFLHTHSTKQREQSVTTPVAMFISYYDEFFDQNAGLRQFANISAPKRIVLYPAAHELPTQPEQQAYVNDVLNRWLAYWLKDEQQFAGVASPDSAVTFIDASTGTHRVYAANEEDHWLGNGSMLPESMYPVRFYFTRRGLHYEPDRSENNQNFTYVNLLGSTTQTYRQAFELNRELPFRISTRPGKWVVRGGGTGAQIQFNLLLYDVDTVNNTRRSITRSHVQLPGTADTTVEVELNTVMHTLRAGHLIEARVSAGIALLPDQQNNFGNYVVGPVSNSITRFSTGGDEPWSYFELYFDYEIPTSVTAQPVADHAHIAASWPQPVRTAGHIRYVTAHNGNCRLSIYDSRGREVRVLQDGPLQAGMHDAAFSSGALPTGMYFAVLRSGGHVDRVKLLLLR
ncbi:alpha/beta fold hydrolase [bacterium]|nr:alpha/beta fold hydrolase [bacterium]